jgi:hypothetical protein
MNQYLHTGTPADPDPAHLRKRVHVEDVYRVPAFKSQYYLLELY